MNNGVAALKGTETYAFISTCIPCDWEIKTVRIHEHYELGTVRTSMKLLGSLCDYGVRSYYPMRSYAYAEIMHVVEDAEDIIDALLSQSRLTADEAFTLLNKGRKYTLSEVIKSDYEVVVGRAIDLFNCFYLLNPVFGKFSAVEGIVKMFECDCLSDNAVLDMKVAKTYKHTRAYWTQVLIYSMLARMIDGKDRRTIGLILPVQGIVQYFRYTGGQYISMYNRFAELYRKERVWV